MKPILRLDRMLGSQRSVAIAAAGALRPPDSRGATGRFYMRAFIYLYIYRKLMSVWNACYHFDSSSFLKAIDS